MKRKFQIVNFFRNVFLIDSKLKSFAIKKPPVAERIKGNYEGSGKYILARLWQLVKHTLPNLIS